MVIDLPSIETSRSRVARTWIARELAKSAAVLVPLRLFMGVGWLRTFLEKVGDAAWWNGSAVRDFLDQQVTEGFVVFPFYERMIDTIFRSGSLWIGWLVIVLELAIGIAILTGTYTNLALIVAAGLNLNFMLAGRITPSVFYIAIETLLFVTGVGSVFGVDGGLRKRSTSTPLPIALVARRPGKGSIENDVSDVAVLAILAAAFSLLGFVHASDFGPGGVNDPGLVLGAVMAMSAMTLGLYAGGLFIRESWRRENAAAQHTNGRDHTTDRLA